MCSETVKTANKNDGEEDAVDGGDSFRKEIGNGDAAQKDGGRAETDGDFDSGDPDVAGEFVFLIVPVIAQHQYAERLQEEAPHHAESIGFAEQINIAAAERDSDDLQERR